MTTTVLNTKFSEVGNKIPDNAIYITNQEFNKLTAESFKETLKKPNLVSKTNFKNKLITFDKKMLKKHTKYLEV